VRASSAAPTYFEPVRVSSVDGSETRALIDGGIFANNPAMCAFVEAQKVFPRAKNYVILSIGTGVFSRSWSYEQVKDWGVLEWLMPSKGVPATAMMSTGLSRTVDYQLTHLPGVEYHRINIDLENCSNGMDDASEENMRCLRLRAEEAIRRFDTTINRIVEVLD
jgi:predicted acylesterase/phospholipase RssA